MAEVYGQMGKKPKRNNPVGTKRRQKPNSMAKFYLMIQHSPSWAYQNLNTSYIKEKLIAIGVFNT